MGRETMQTTMQASVAHSLAPLLSRTSSMELLRPVSSREPVDILPRLKRRASNLSVDTASFGAIVENVISPELTSKPILEAATSNQPAMVRAPSGNSFASVPFAMERVPSLSRVPSGLSQISVDLNQVGGSAEGLAAAEAGGTACFKLRVRLRHIHPGEMRIREGSAALAPSGSPEPEPRAHVCDARGAGAFRAIQSAPGMDANACPNAGCRPQASGRVRGEAGDHGAREV